MTLTIGMASFNNHAEVWFTVQALRMYQDLADTEILVIDNFGDDELKSAVEGCADQRVRYVRYTEKQGTAAAKNRIFVEARGDWVLVIDSHVLLRPGVVALFRDWVSCNPSLRDLLQGPLLYADLKTTADAFNDEWRGQMWGTWRHWPSADTDAPYEIPMMGMGLFACRKDAWLGFNPEFRGFGGEEGYIHEKYRQAGQRTLCLPFLKWLHYFRPGNGSKQTAESSARSAPYPVLLKDKIRNYLIGFQELGLDLAPIYEHFGKKEVDDVFSTLPNNRIPPDITYIVSCFEKPDHLAMCLYSLKVQTHANFEVIVTDNSADGRMESVVKGMNDRRFHYCNPKQQDCYSSAERGAAIAKGKYLCFPSDDSYYVPQFGERMLRAAAAHGWDLVYCEMLYDPRFKGVYNVLGVQAKLNHIDKTGFLLLRGKFRPFPGKHQLAASDGYLIEHLVNERKVSHGKVDEIMVVHN